MTLLCDWLARRNLPDIIYPVRRGDCNEKLRYSLRSIAANFPHANVWVVGHRPHWLTNCGFIPGNHFGTDQANVYNNIRLAVEHPDVRKRVVIFNDDFFVTRPVTHMPVYMRSPLYAHIELPRVQRQHGSWWHLSLLATQNALQARGIEHPYSYELHMPMPARKYELAAALREFQYVQPENPPQWRSVYGNLWQVPAERIADVKVFKGGKLKAPFHSTDEHCFPAYLDQLHALFPRPSRYEKPCRPCWPPCQPPAGNGSDGSDGSS
jgi:hypothetical protein